MEPSRPSILVRGLRTFTLARVVSTASDPSRLSDIETFEGTLWLREGPSSDAALGLK